MAYQYVAYNTKGSLVKGRLFVEDDKAAGEMLGYAGYQVISIKPYSSFLNREKLINSLYRVKTGEIVLLYRQLAMLLEAGTNVRTSLEMLTDQSTNPRLKTALREVAMDVRGGTQLSAALAKHPKLFSPTYCDLLAIGEQGGELETLLRQVADYMEKEALTVKQTKDALTMPAITAVIAVLVVGLLITFVLPSFAKMYDSLGAQLPPLARAFMSLGDQVRSNGLYVLAGLAVVTGGMAFYSNTKRGRYHWDMALLRMPLMGRIRLLIELARYSRNMSMLFHAGMPLNDIMPQIIRGSRNRVLAKALTDVQQGMIKGEGLSGPMSRNDLFLPMMVQMVKVGEETGSLDITLKAVAQSYEAEAADRIHSLVSMIQPAMTIALGGVVGVIAVTLMSAMTSMYGKL